MRLHTGATWLSFFLKAIQSSQVPIHCTTLSLYLPETVSITSLYLPDIVRVSTITSLYLRDTSYPSLYLPDAVSISSLYLPDAVSITSLYLPDTVSKTSLYLPDSDTISIPSLYLATELMNRRALVVESWLGKTWNGL